MGYDEHFQAALAALPCPVSKEPASGGAETYAVFNEAQGSFAGYASNTPHRLRHMVQVHIYSRRDDGTHEALLGQAIRLLRAAGVRVYHFGPDLYEADTGYHHIAATCVWTETTE